MIPLQYSNLKAHITQQVGHNKKFDGIVKLKLPQKKFTQSTTLDSNNRDDPFCETCRNNSNTEVQEDYKHALYACPNAQLIIKHLTTTFFPNTPNPQFNISVILDSNTKKISKDYDCQGGRDFINLIWDLYQVLVTMDHTAEKTPNKNLI
jgi:hypothetical protein